MRKILSLLILFMLFSFVLFSYSAAESDTWTLTDSATTRALFGVRMHSSDPTSMTGVIKTLSNRLSVATVANVGSGDAGLEIFAHYLLYKYGRSYFHLNVGPRTDFDLLTSSNDSHITYVTSINGITWSYKLTPMSMLHVGAFATLPSHSPQPLTFFIAFSFDINATRP